MLKNAPYQQSSALQHSVLGVRSSAPDMAWTLSPLWILSEGGRQTKKKNRRRDAHRSF